MIFVECSSMRISFSRLLRASVGLLVIYFFTLIILPSTHLSLTVKLIMFLSAASSKLVEKEVQVRRAVCISTNDHDVDSAGGDDFLTNNTCAFMSGYGISQINDEGLLCVRIRGGGGTCSPTKSPTKNSPTKGGRSLFPKRKSVSIVKVI